MSRAEEITERWARASTRPWSVGEDEQLAVASVWVDVAAIGRQDAEAIAHAPDDIDWLLGERARLLAALGQVVAWDSKAALEHGRIGVREYAARVLEESA